MNIPKYYSGEIFHRNSAGHIVQIDRYHGGDRISSTFIVSGAKYLVINYIQDQIIGDVSLYNPITGNLEERFTEAKGKVRV